MKRLNESMGIWENMLVKMEEGEEQTNLDRSILDESWKRSWQVNRLVLLVKEPTTIFAYWEVNDSRKQLICDHFQCAWTELSFFLQVNDVTDLEFNGYNAHSSRRIPVQSLSDHWVITGVQAGRRYLVDFGTLTPQGSYFTILRSNIEETPPQHSGREVEPYLRFAVWPKPDGDEDGSGAKLIIRGHKVRESWLRQFDGYSFVQPDGGQYK